MALLELAHVDDREETLPPEKEIGHGQGGFGLPHPRWPHEEEYPQGLARILEPCRRRAEHLGHCGKGRLLSLDAAAKVILQGEDPGGPVLLEAPQGDAGPVGHHPRHHLRVHLDPDEGRLPLERRQAFRGLGHLLLQLVAALLVFRCLRGQLLPQGHYRLGQLPFLVPAFRDGRKVFPQFRHLSRQGRETLAINNPSMELVPGDGRLLPLQGLDAAFLFFHGSRLAGQEELHPGCSRIEEVHRLVRELAPREVAGGELRRGPDAVVPDGDPVGRLVLFL